jgi:hypothetical protein
MNRITRVQSPPPVSGRLREFKRRTQIEEAPRPRPPVDKPRSPSPRLVAKRQANS